MGSQRIDGGPRSAVVIGAGIVGLSTAWFLQERGVEVTVVDRTGVAAGSSWGNAGWLSPALAIPLNEPSVLRYGLRSLLDRQAPLSIPVAAPPRLWQFLAGFARHCSWRCWEQAALGNLPLSAECLDAYDALVAGGVEASTIPAPITAVFDHASGAEALRHELARMARAGQHIDYAELSGEELRAALPQVSERARVGLQLEGQRHIDPGAFTRSLGDAVGERGTPVRQRFEVTEVSPRGDRFVVRARSGETVAADAVVVATGAWLSRLGRQWGVRVPVSAGRGYSFTVPVDKPVPGPIYLPTARVACTPYRDQLRVAGTMEFRDPDAPLDGRRIDAIIASVRPLLRGVRWEERTDAWVGPRPVTTDGLPLIGETRVPGIFVAGGHGMWGVTQGPITGRLLAEQITTGKQPDALRALNPLR